jgi:hypothetical protein
MRRRCEGSNKQASKVEPAYAPAEIMIKCPTCGRSWRQADSDAGRIVPAHMVTR